MQWYEVEQYKGKNVLFMGGTYQLIGLKRNNDSTYTAKLLDLRTRNCVIWARLEDVKGKP